MRRSRGGRRAACALGWNLALALLIAGGGLARPAMAEPTWWLSLGGLGAEETGRLGDILDEPEAGGFLGAGWHLLRLGSLLLALDVEGSGAHGHAVLGLEEDTVSIWRGRVGLRVTWWDEDRGWPLVPYLRGGAVYRKDEGRFVDDEGAGWFAGGGLDWRLAEHWAVGPFVSYEEASLSIPSRTWLFGVGLTYSR